MLRLKGNRLSWVCGRVTLWTRSIISLRADDIILAGFPKTGSTWIRYFLYLVLTQRKDGMEHSIDAMNAAMPEFANASFFLEWPFEECSRLVKTHQKCLPFFKTKQSVLVVRDPRDIVVSYFHYLTGLKHSGFGGSVSDVLKDPQMGVEAFLKHYASWKPHVSLVLKYEDLKAYPSVGFGHLLECLGLSRSSIELAEAIEQSNLKNMRNAQESSVKLKGEFKVGHQFVRSGKLDQWKEVFTSEDVRYYEAMRTKYDFHLYD